MAKSQQSFNKKEREKKRRKKRQDKLERREQRKLNKEQSGKKTFEDQLSYVDEHGNLSSTPPDPTKKQKIKAEDIILGIPPKSKEPVEKIRTGKVKFFNHDKGYGFISDSISGDSIFVHANQCTIALQENDKVTYEVEKGPKGLNATNVKMAEA
jgi:cold shock CspA family protein